MNEPTYDGGNYCVEHMENGKWKKKKTGRFLSRNWNQITINYAKYQYEQQTRLGNASRIVRESDSKVMWCNDLLWLTEAHLAWHDLLEQHLKKIGE